MAYYRNSDEIEAVEELASEINVENEIDRDNLHELIQQIANKYSFISRINPRDDAVCKILDITECNSWKKFQNQHLDLLLEYMDASPNDAGPQDIEQEKDTKFEWKIPGIEKRLSKIRLQLKEQQTLATEQFKRKGEIRTDFIRARQHYLIQRKRARLSPTIKQECDELEAEMRALIDEQNEISLTDYTSEIMELRHDEIRLVAELNFIKRAKLGTFWFYCNTDDVQWNALRYNSAAQDAAFEYSRCLDDEVKHMEELAKQRYQPEEAENFSSEFSASSETFAARRLRETRDRMSFIQDAFAEYEHGYLINEEIYMAQNDGKIPLYKPKDGRPHRWMTLEERVSFLQEKKNSFAHLSDDSLFVMP